MKLETKPEFFKTQSDFRKWLSDNYNKENELLVGYYKVGSGKQSMRWSESVDQALCFGWIDGIRKSIDSESYLIRFTPRKKNSIWSAVNIKKIEELTAKGLMKPSGLDVFNLRKENKSAVYTYENAEKKLSPEFEKEFRQNNKAWNFFQLLPPSYRKPASFWVMSAKQEKTRIKRLRILINDSEEERKIKPLSY